MEREPRQGDPFPAGGGVPFASHRVKEVSGPRSHPCPVSPGLLWQLRPSDVEVELLAHTRDVVSRELPAETGLHTGWVQNGGLFIASSKQRLDEYKRLMSVGRRPSVCPQPGGILGQPPVSVRLLETGKMLANAQN